MKKLVTKRQLNTLTIDQLRALRDEIQDLIKEKRESSRTGRRGNPGEKIRNACLAVTEKPQPATTFCQKQGISMSTIRQIRKWDPIVEPPIQVRKIGGNLYIWRGDPDPLKQTK